MSKLSYWHRFQRSRISRRRLLATTGAGAAGLAVAAACGGGENGGGVTPGETPEVTDAGTPKAGGTYRSTLTNDWGTLDPLTSVGGAPGIFGRIYNALMDRSRTDPSVEVFDLAESLETPDEETFNFTIRRGVKIAPNDLGIPERDMDAFDAEAWQDRVDADETAIMRSFTHLDEGRWLASYGASDAQTFQMKTDGPYGYFYFRIGPPLGATIPPKEFFQNDISITDQSVGAGPYVVRPGSYQETGGIIMDRNPNYYLKDAENNDAQLPYIETLDVARIDDRGTRRTAFQDGQIDTYGAETLEEAQAIQDGLAGSYRTEDPVNTFISFTMNPDRPPWDDENIRKAALHALDRQVFIDRIVQGNGQANGLVHWPMGAYAFDEEELEEFQAFDPQLSKDLIRQATGEDTVSVKIMHPVGTDTQFIDKHVPIFFQQMGEAGFDVEVEEVEFGTWLARYTTLDYDASLSLNQVYEIAETALDWQQTMGPAGTGQFGKGIGSIYPEIDAAIERSKTIIGREEQAQAVRDAQKLVYDKGPGFLPIMSWIGYTLYQPFVKNVARGPGGTPLGGTGQYVNTRWLDLPS